MATSTSTIDPVSRIEGHLRVEMEVEDGVIKNAWTSAGLFRGMELILENRAPHDAVSIVQRICGVCPVSHSNVSAIAAEKAFGMMFTEGPSCFAVMCVPVAEAEW